MRIVASSVQEITEKDPLKRIEICGRVCYKSENKITDDSALGFVRRLVSMGHFSVLEHAAIRHETGSMTAREYVESGGDIEGLCHHQLDPDHRTFRIICDRAIANELVRHRRMSFSQESTRYVNYTKKGMEFVLPTEYPISANQIAYFGQLRHIWSITEQVYNIAIAKGVPPQFARNLLPLSLKTELVMSGYIDNWKLVLGQRRAKDAHPQIQTIANEIGRILGIGFEVNK